jgi:septal ring factor EnvC (AmiA/AmiB activator)
LQLDAAAAGSAALEVEAAAAADRVRELSDARVQLRGELVATRRAAAVAEEQLVAKLHATSDELHATSDELHATSDELHAARVTAAAARESLDARVEQARGEARQELLGQVQRAEEKREWAVEECDKMAVHNDAVARRVDELVAEERELRAVAATVKAEARAAAAHAAARLQVRGGKRRKRGASSGGVEEKGRFERRCGVTVDPLAGTLARCTACGVATGTGNVEALTNRYRIGYKEKLGR